MSRCGCSCVCHDDEHTSEWPGPCAACCEPGMPCECGVRTPYYRDDWLTVYLGDCRAVLATLPSDSVNCVISSPPYYGLRDYGTAQWEGGDEGCDHKPPFQPRSERPNVTGSGMGDGYAGQEPRYGDTCGKCGARRIDSQIGLEPTPERYVAELVAVFREVRRVLRPDGTCWLNLGDSYAGSGKGAWGSDESREANRVRVKEVYVPTRAESPLAGKTPDGLKPKDRMMIPARVALALQADGWWLRDEIVWAKPNPMPSSVTDRTTPAHEMVYLLTKRARYAYDAEAIRETALWPDGPNSPESIASPYGQGFTRRARNVGGRSDGFTQMPGGEAEWAENGRAGRNKRSVWTIATQPYPEAHFATFPEALVEPMVLAGCPEGGTVLDPFAGSGTVGLVAQRLSRRAILIDLSAEYMRQLMKRNQDMPLGLVAS